MRLGIDFGTTHTVVALVDRGNYPVVSFESADFVPSLVAARDADGALCFGLDAAAVRHEPGWTVLKSFKRLLNDAGPFTEAEIGERSYPVAALLTGFLSRLREDLENRSNASLVPGEPLEAAVSVPANASSAQRFLTLDSFRRAGFRVAALLNEPSAAGFEYAHRFRGTLTAKKEYVFVYDLGGGTFDASLLRMTGKTNEVVSTSGVRRLGGDDFDDAILGAVMKAAGIKRLPRGARASLLEECARQKEAVGPNTRRFLVDLSALSKEPVSLPIEDVWEACAPLAEKTMNAIEPLFEGAGPEESDLAWADIAGLYVVGGAGAFPLVARILKERFGEKRIRRSPHPFAATAIGLAISLDKDAGWALSERLSRHFGVFREASSGGDITFDPIFSKDSPLPRAGEPPLTTIRRYRATHNIGHFRYLECSRLNEGRPDGDVTPWDDVFFPFERALRNAPDLGAVPVQRRDADGEEIEERYACASDGAISVTLTSREDGFSRSFALKRANAS